MPDIGPFPDENPKPAGFPFILLVVLLLVALMGSMTGSGIVYAISQAKGIDLQELLRTLDKDAPLGIRQFLRLANLITHSLTFAVPALLVGWFFYRRNWLRFFRLDQRPGMGNLVLGILFIVLAFPVAQLSYWINKQLPLPEWATRMESSAEGMLESLLVMNSPGELLFNLLVVAVVPAIGEELVFRGIVQQRLQSFFRNPAWAIWVTAIIFSTIHLQFQGFFPRIILGAALGYLFYRTNNLWVPVIAHFVSNGMQVVAQYFMKAELSEMDIDKPEIGHWVGTLFALILLAGIGRRMKG